MEVKINKEIRNYTESMFFGLSMRQFIFSVLACGVAVGLYFLLRPQFGTETLSWMCILGASPFAMMGFIKYNGTQCSAAGFQAQNGRVCAQVPHIYRIFAFILLFIWYTEY